MEAQKSGLRIVKQGDILFREDDKAESLFIIQKGLIRLFRPKGSGFVDINILRVGEVIGEMAYFDKKSRQRSCSASALVETEIIEVSFVVLDKLIKGLNPWFKT
ncbi:MAG: cyclic nucleotide-binding domain-containing protein, partial [Halobacteriovoraceae bacterium]|nr:cyclic nucleotide-binding domain-containing protein [Halobacteriovoraceae bacterium]